MSSKSCLMRGPARRIRSNAILVGSAVAAFWCLLALAPVPAIADGEHIIGSTTYGLFPTVVTEFNDSQGPIYSPPFADVPVHDWTWAESRAEFYGGHLATIGTLPLNAVLKNAFGSFTDKAWIGLHYNTGYGSETGAPPPGKNWRWAVSGTSSPGYRNFATGYPQAGVDASGNDYAAMRFSDGRWVDAYPSQSFPMYALYQLARASVVPVTLDCPVYASAFYNSNTGANSAYAMEDFGGMGPPGVRWATSVNASGGDWGGRIESLLLMAADPNGDVGASSGAGTDPTGTLTVGTSTQCPNGTPILLNLSVHETDPLNSTWHFALKRGASTIYTTSTPTESQVSVLTGETLTVDFSQAVSGYIGPGGSSDLAVDMWVTPEPATLSLLALGGVALLRRRR